MRAKHAGAAGRREERLIFQFKTTTINPGGGRAEVWTDAPRVEFGVLSAPRLPANAESVTAGALSSRIPLTLKVRASAIAQTVTPACRVVIRGRVHNIRAVGLPDAHGEITMLVESGVPT